MRAVGSVLLVMVVSSAVVLAPPAYASDVNLNLTFDDFTSQTGTHEDSSPFKGWLSLTVTNNMSQSWGDIHFQIMDVGWDVSTVEFVVDAPYTPTSSQAGLSWVVNNQAYGSTLDLYYYGDAVLPGETATFAVWTDNTTAQVPFFGWSIYPTPLPEPASLALLALGGMLVAKRRR